jgi:hypothetical protein
MQLSGAIIHTDRSAVRMIDLATNIITMVAEFTGVFYTDASGKNHWNCGPQGVAVDSRSNVCEWRGRLLAQQRF